MFQEPHGADHGGGHKRRKRGSSEEDHGNDHGGEHSEGNHGADHHDVHHVSVLNIKLKIDKYLTLY